MCIRDRLREVWLFAVEYEGVLALLLTTWVVVPEVPVTALYGALLLVLRITHTTLESV